VRSFLGIRRHPTLPIVAALAISLLGIACGEDHDNRVAPGPVTPSTQLTGLFLNRSEAGLMSVTISRDLRTAAALPESVVTASGVLSPDGGGVVNLTGTYDTETDSLYLTGQAYDVRAEYIETAIPQLRGEYSGPNGSGSIVGMAGGTNVVRVFCGQFQSATTAIIGRWNIVIIGTMMMGLESGDSSIVEFSGSVAGSGGSRSMSFTSSGIEPVLHGDGIWTTATNHVAGTWMTEDDTGTWSGDLCLPGTTGPN
jgi:hypothetical protein